MFLTPEDVRELTGYRRYGKQAAHLAKNNIAFTVALSGRPLVTPQALGAPEPKREPDYIYTSGPWYSMGITPHEWREQNRESLFVDLSALADRRIPSSQVNSGECGVYFLFDAEGGLQYIGRSVCIANRIISHRRARQLPFTHVAWVAVPKLLVEGVESDYIAKHQPPWNTRGIR